MCAARWEIGLCIRYTASISIGKGVRAKLQDRAVDCINQDHNYGLERCSAGIIQLDLHPPACACTAFHPTIGGRKTRG
jgi:hypothetical protein